MDQDSFNDRFSERVAVDCKARLEDEGGRAIEVELTDVSAGGFQCKCLERIEIGDYYMLNVGPSGRYPVRILWKLVTGVGGEFVQPLSWGRLFALVASIHTGEEIAQFDTSPAIL